MKLNPLTCIDFYKADHRRQYPTGTTEVYSNFTPRTSRIDGINQVLFFGLQYFLKDYMTLWQTEFFDKPLSKVINYYKLRMDSALGINVISTDHIKSLHQLGYLPLEIKALPEGMLSNIGVPLLTIVNTHPDFFWLTNYIETALSAYLWKPITVATIAFQYRKILEKYCNLTGGVKEFIKFQAHDFSFRGLSNIQDAAVCGAAHLTSFVGTDSIPGIELLLQYYDANALSQIIGTAVPATEHSVMCMGGKLNELDTFKHLINEIYPTGIVSIVSDTWDYWNVIDNFLPILKDNILKRDGKVVIRPDSGDPEEIILKTLPKLWEIFGGTRNPKGYKEIHPKIGLIYGDSITLQRAESILKRMMEEGFASTNIVFGVGSYSYQYITRDTFGFAVKSTSGIVNGERRDIFKCPLTDTGVKKSAKGLLRVEWSNYQTFLYDEQTKEQEKKGVLKTVFLNGVYLHTTDLWMIRAHVEELFK